jgi:putative acetyltransferase
MEMQFREIIRSDNSQLALIIRNTLKEHGVDKPGTVFTDPTTDSLYELFQTTGNCYFVATINYEIVGGCGVYQTFGLPESCAELVKLYISSIHRDKGIGYKLIEMSIEKAKSLGYKSLYLETLPELSKAISLYERLGFKLLEKPLGDSGHFACNIWMLKVL